MVFSSAIFLFGFLPIVLGLYFLVPKAYKNTLLLIVSLLFYSWGETLYVLVMLISIAANYGFGLLIDKSSERPTRGLALAGAIAVNLGIFGFYKYANFIADNINLLLELANIPLLEPGPQYLPLGISFFTFQAMSYIVDVYRQQVPVQRNLLNMGLYISFFPQLIAGPIVRYHDVALQITDRSHSADLFVSGVRRFVFGLAKKLIIANFLGQIADDIFSLEQNNLSTSIAWLGLLCYTLQIYFDFSGYSDMAIGLGRMFGFRFLENFNYPYSASSLQDFWRRWHMSLSRWFRDYLYIPLGGNRCAPWRLYLNLFTVFFLCGLWHGASWNFVIWGMIHGAFLVLERLGGSALLEKTWLPLRHLYTLLVVMIAWVFFRVDTLPDALYFLKTLSGMVPSGDSVYSVSLFYSHQLLLTLVVACTLALPFYQRVSAHAISFSREHVVLYLALHLIIIGPLLLYCAAYISSGTYNPFIYFRF